MPHNQFATAKTEEIQKKWHLLTAKLAVVEQQHLAETRTEERFRLEQLISQIKEERQRLEAPPDSGIPAAHSAARSTKILFLAANPLNTARLRLDEEVRSITTSLKLAKERIFTQEWAVTPDSLMQAVLDDVPNIIHFSGHGEQEGICLEDENGTAKLVSAEALASLFRLFKDNVQCVLLNACYSETQAKAIAMHIPHVIGMSSSIPDRTAIFFAVGFYKAIGAGKTIPFAYELGKTAIQMQGDAGADLPVLLRPSAS